MRAKHQPNTTSSGAELTAPEPTAAQTNRGGCCGGTVTAAPVIRDRDDVAECPVMAGTTVIKVQAEAAGLYRDYQGQRYWFCCAGCGPIWDADPDEYATP